MTETFIIFIRITLLSQEILVQEEKAAHRHIVHPRNSSNEPAALEFINSKVDLLRLWTPHLKIPITLFSKILSNHSLTESKSRTHPDISTLHQVSGLSHCDFALPPGRDSQALRGNIHPYPGLWLCPQPPGGVPPSARLMLMVWGGRKPLYCGVLWEAARVDDVLRVEDQ